MRTYDLSHSLETDMPVYPGTEPVTVDPAATLDADGYRTTRLDLDSHTGTHVDAPSHLTDGPSLDEFPLDRFWFSAIVADVRPLDAREAIDAEMLRDAVTADPANVDLLVVRTGWGDHWGTNRYLDHPYLTADAATWLASTECDLGVDTINPDPTPTENATDAEPDGFPVHELLFEADRLIVENLRGLDRLPDRFELHAYPLRFADADASPVRAVAYPEETVGR